MADISRLKGTLLKSNLQNTNQPLFQVINQLIDSLSQANSSISSINVLPSSTTIIAGGTGTPGMDGIDGEESVPVPGPQGIQGLVGPQGASGNIFVLADDGDDTDFIPPQTGPQGNPGPTGSPGPSGPTILVEDGLDGEDGLNFLIQTINSGWKLVGSNTPVAQATVDFTGLDGATDIRVLVIGMTLSLSGEVRLRISIDNGLNFKSASGDYVGISGGGIATNHTDLQFYSGGTTAARSGEILISGCDLAAPKSSRSNFFSTDSVNLQYMPTTSPINAVRIFSTAGTMSTGTIYVFTR